MEELVQRLAEGDHPVIMQRYKSAEELKQAIDRGYVLVKFTDTRGGTELGFRLDNAATDLSQADFSHATGNVHVVGNLTLNYVKVCGVADVNVATLEGKGHLEILEQ
ncbi:hypothetical protein TFLX_01880 [Thermoflexales bacterium]|nr:hypothetical protein TFLX_01880 [Thermoflexales bacterium]